MKNQEPKTCRNCGRYYTGNCHLPGAVIQIQEIVKNCGDWQPKPAEPQDDWIGKLIDEFMKHGIKFDCLERVVNIVRPIIHAEIERVRIEEQNKHRGEK